MSQLRARLAGRLADDGGDDGSSAGSAVGILIAGAGVLAAIWMIGLFTTANTAIKTAPKLGKYIPFL